jgi:hypothetical protein
MHAGKLVFAQLLEFAPWHTFRRLLAKYQGDFNVRRFSCLDQFLCMAFAQLTYRESLRDIEACLRAQPEKLYHMGIRGNVSRSALADANESRDWRIYFEFAQSLIRLARELYANESLGIELKETVYALDSTTIDLCLSMFEWAALRQTKAAVKLNTLLDLRGSIPTYIHISDGKLHDVNVLDLIERELGAFYVMDRGYVDQAGLQVRSDWELLCHACQVELQIPENHGQAGRSQHRRTLRSGGRAGGLLLPSTLSRATASYPLSGSGEAVSHFPDKQHDAARNDRLRSVPPSLGGRTLFQIDQTAFAHQALLRNIRERGQDPSVGRGRHIRARSHHSKAAQLVSVAAYDASNLERHPVRKTISVPTIEGSRGRGITANSANQLNLP